MAQHVQILAILHLVFGGLGVMFGVGFLGLLGGISTLVGFNAPAPDALVAIPVLLTVGTVVFFLTAVLSLPSIICGVGLLQFRSWARILGIVLSALRLPEVPFGTLLGVYGLWVLLSEQTIPLFEQPQPQETGLPAHSSR